MTESLYIESDHGGVSPVCEHCDHYLARDAPVLRVECLDGGPNHTICMLCINRVLKPQAEVERIRNRMKQLLGMPKDERSFVDLWFEAEAEIERLRTKNAILLIDLKLRALL